MKIQHRSIAVLVAASVLATVSAGFGQVVTRNNSIKINGKSYFRGGAEDVSLGDYGDKKTPVTKMNYLEVKGSIPASKLKQVESVLVIDIDTSKTSKSDLTAGLSDVSGVFGGSIDMAWSKAQRHQLKLVKLVLKENRVRKAVNDSPVVLNNLKDLKNGARICNEVFVVLEAKIAEQLEHSTAVSLSGTDGKLKLTASGGNSGSRDTTITLSKGSTFAYGLVKIDWAKGKTRVDSLEDDQHGLN